MKVLTFALCTLALAAFGQASMAGCDFHSDAKVTLHTPTEPEKQTENATPLPTDDNGKLIVDTKKPETTEAAN